MTTPTRLPTPPRPPSSIMTVLGTIPENLNDSSDDEEEQHEADHRTDEDDNNNNNGDGAMHIVPNSPPRVIRARPNPVTVKKVKRGNPRRQQQQRQQHCRRGKQQQQHQQNMPLAHGSPRHHPALIATVRHKGGRDDAWDALSPEARYYACASYKLSRQCGLIMLYCWPRLIFVKIQGVLRDCVEVGRRQGGLHDLLILKHELRAHIGTIVSLRGRGLRRDMADDFFFPLDLRDCVEQLGDRPRTTVGQWDLLIEQAMSLLDEFSFESHKSNGGPLRYLGMDGFLLNNAMAMVAEEARLRGVGRPDFGIYQDLEPVEVPPLDPPTATYSETLRYAHNEQSFMATSVTATGLRRPFFTHAVTAPSLPTVGSDGGRNSSDASQLSSQSRADTNHS